MSPKSSLLALAIAVLCFTVLFFKQAAGINFILFEILMVGYMAFTKQLDWKSFHTKLTAAALMLTAIAVVWANSTFSMVVNVLTAVVFVGVVSFPNVRSICTAFGIGLAHTQGAQKGFIDSITNLKSEDKTKRRRFGSPVHYIIPVMVILVFVVIYALANHAFYLALEKMGLKVFDFFNYIFGQFNVMLVYTVLIGVVVCNFFFWRQKYPKIELQDSNGQEVIVRKRKKLEYLSSLTALHSEYRAAIFLLVSLNLLLLFVNALDIRYVWLGFEWQGKNLSSFVHEGTYLLIFSILISIAVVLFIFRKNLNFYRQAKWLKPLAFAWIAQNVFLCLSVGVRDFWYIHYFSLAYKRIGVIFFLILVIIGLITVWIKVRDKRSSFYLFRINSMSIFVVLTICSFIRWDEWIAQYNFSRSFSSNLDMEFLASLTDKALPYIIHSEEELNNIQNYKQENYQYRDHHLSVSDYVSWMQTRELLFIARWESQGFWSWNWPEHSAYMKLKIADQIP